MQNTPNCLQLTMSWSVLVLSFDKSSWKLCICDAVLEIRQRFWCLCCRTNSYLAYWRPSRARFCPMQWLFLWSKANQHASHSALMHWIVSNFFNESQWRSIDIISKSLHSSRLRYKKKITGFDWSSSHSNTLKWQHLWSTMKYSIMYQSAIWI